MRGSIEPCLCGDTECPRCFPRYHPEYGRKARTTHLTLRVDDELVKEVDQFRGAETRTGYILRALRWFMRSSDGRKG